MAATENVILALPKLGVLKLSKQHGMNSLVPSRNMFSSSS